MGIAMNKEQIKSLVIEIAKDLSALSAQLTEINVEAALNAELEHHLGYTSHERKGQIPVTVVMVIYPNKRYKPG